MILVRHGETAWNAEGRFQGHTDVPLSDRGRRQAEALARRLAREKIDAIYASDLQRAWETATIIAAPHGLEVRPEPRLREMHFGVWEGLTFDEIEARYPGSFDLLVTDPLAAGPPQGETMGEVMARVQALLEDLQRRHAQQTVLLVAHGGSFQMLMCHSLGLTPRARWQFRLSPASLSELYLFPEGGILTRLNDVCHLG